MKLQNLLSRLILFCVGPMLLLVAYLTVSAIIHDQAKLKTEAFNLVKNFNTAIDQRLDARISALHMLAESPLIDDKSRLKDLYHEAQGFHKGFGSHVVLADPKMHMLFNTRVSFGTKLPMLPRPKGFAAVPAALETGEPAVGDVFFGPIAGEPLVSIAVPALREGKVAYLLLTTFETRHFQERLNKVSLPSGWTLTLLDSNNEAIAKLAPPGFNSAKDVSPSGRFSVNSTVSRWSVVLEIPRHIYYGSVIKSAIALTIAILCVVFVSILGGMWARRRVMKAVLSLTESHANGSPPPDIEEIAAVRRLLIDSAEKQQRSDYNLKESEERFRLVQENSPDGFTILQPVRDDLGRVVDFTWVYENEIIARLNGTEPKAVVGRSLLEIFPGHSDTQFFKAYQQVTESGKNCVFEANFLGEGNTKQIWFRIVVVPTGENIAILAQDITERKAEEARRESQLRLSRILVEAESLEAAAPEIVRTLTEAIGWDYGELWLYDATANKIFRNTSWHRGTPGLAGFDEVSRDWIFSGSEGLPGKAFDQGRIIWSTDLLADLCFLRRESAAKAGLHSAVAVPLWKDKSIHGILIFFSNAMQREEKPLLQFLEDACHRIGHFVARKRAEAALLESEDVFRFVFESANVGKSITLPTGEISVNKAFCEMLGYSKEELTNKIWQDLTPPDEIASVQAHLAALLTGEKDSARFTKRYVHKNGFFVWADVSVVMRRKEDGNPLHFITTIIDITERKKAEESLRAREESYGILFREMQNGFAHSEIVCDAQGCPINSRYLAVNPAFERITGRKAEDVVGKTILEVFPALEPSWIETFGRVALTGESAHFEQQASELGITFDVSAFCPAPNQYACTFTDITARKQIEIERQKFFLLVESSSEFIGMCDLDMNPLYVNPAGRRMVGLPDMAAACRVKVQDYYFPEDQRFIAEEFFPRVLREGHGDVEIRLRHFQTGEPIWMFYYLFSVHDASGTPVGWATVSRDITDRKRADEELLKYRDHLEELVKERTFELDRANVRLQELDRLKSMFIASMSHELRTPLNSIIGFTGIILMGMSGEISPIQKKQLGMVKNSATHLLELINDVIDVSKIEAGKTELTIEAFDLSELANEVKESFAVAASGKGLELSMQSEGTVQVTSDRRRVKQILVNLVGNAVKFTEKGTVSILFAQKAAGVEIRVCDTGFGMERKDMERLFEAFSRIHTQGAPIVEGTGLGLYLSRRLAALLGGEITAESEPGRGSEFTLSLPWKYPEGKE
jgi:PAS domain S-box-containing protein